MNNKLVYEKKVFNFVKTKLNMEHSEHYISKFDTCFFERYAREVLVSLLGSQFENLENKDRPDLQNCSIGLGIEVTRAIEESKFTALSLINDLSGDESIFFGNTSLESIKNSGYAYGLHDDLVGHQEYIYWKIALPLKRIIESKVMKASRGFYGDFKELELFVFLKENLSADAITKVMDFTMSLQKYKRRRYKMLYFFQSTTFYVCDLQKARCCAMELSKCQLQQFYKQALVVK